MSGRLALLPAVATAVLVMSGCTSGPQQSTNSGAPTAQATAPTTAASVPASAAAVVTASAPAKPPRGSNYAEYTLLDKNKGIVPPVTTGRDAPGVARSTCDNTPKDMVRLARSLAAVNSRAADRVRLEKAVSDRTSLISAYCVPKEMVSWVDAVQSVDITLNPYAEFPQ